MKQTLGLVLVALLWSGPAGAASSYKFASGYKPVSCKAYDGDTVNCVRKSGTRKLRLVTLHNGGIDAPELTVACQKKRAIEARDELNELLEGEPIKVREVTNRKDKYGRSLAAILVKKLDVAQELLDQGLVRPYNGGKREPWPGCPA